MPKGFAKGIKPLFLQRLALLIGICYLMNPLQPQIKSIFHTISHAIEVPNSVIGHDSNSENEEVHGHFEHEIADLQHDHTLIDLLDTVLTASNETKDADDSLIIEIKIDKHITTCKYQLFANPTVVESNKFWLPKEKLKSGYLQNQKEPPRYSHS